MSLRLQFCDVDENPAGPCQEKYEVLPLPEPLPLPHPEPPPLPLPQPEPPPLPQPLPPPLPPVPVVEDERLSVLPEQSTLLDVVALIVGIALTFTVPHDWQPSIVYVIFAVPAVMPVTTPDVLMVATNVLLSVNTGPNADPIYPKNAPAGDGAPKEGGAP